MTYGEDLLVLCGSEPEELSRCAHVTEPQKAPDIQAAASLPGWHTSLLGTKHVPGSPATRGPLDSCTRTLQAPPARCWPLRGPYPPL